MCPSEDESKVVGLYVHGGGPDKLAERIESLSVAAKYVRIIARVPRTANKLRVLMFRAQVILPDRPS